jgi:hypothetical protein
MTILNRFCPEASDIVAIRLECSACDAAISYSPARWNPSTLRCPNCAAELVGPSPHSKESIALRELADSLKILRNPTTNLAFRLRLEFESPVG